MSLERKLLGRWHNGDLLPEEYMQLMKETKELLAQPEPIKEREVLGKIISTDDACNWNLTVAALKDYDYVYVNGIRYTEYQPDINTQYLLDQVSRLTAENAMIKEKWLAPPKREPLSDEEIEKFWEDNFYNGINFYARAIEKAHGITGVDDE